MSQGVPSSINWYQTLLEFLTVFVGVFAAFVLDSYRAERQRKEDASKILRIVCEELDQDATIVESIAADLNQPDGFGITTQRLRLSTWNAVSGRIEAISNTRLLADVGKLYFDIELFNKILESYLELLYASARMGNQILPNLNTARNRLMNDLNMMARGASGLRPQLRAVITMINSELNA